MKAQSFEMLERITIIEKKKPHPKRGNCNILLKSSLKVFFFDVNVA
ncbi:hypothetical protein FTV88_1271 [Heliorestis convoluta]|uniref:Uncharacterized protein n=1 Tax=Heliorestis convoluta TaxID=356322 RepID=A0A5Q2MXP2_9FIRM|nr:hypothetical protein FTV88_1271 [Heliorestis convoluta]